MSFAPDFYPLSEEWKDFEKSIGGIPPLDLRDAASARIELRKRNAQGSALAPPLSEKYSAKTQSITHNGFTMDVKIYHPDPEKAGKEPHPLIVYFHGGGFMLGDLDTEELHCASLVVTHHVVLVSVNYYHSPEHPYPAPVDSAYAGFEWAVENAASLGADSNMVITYGSSAGGNLATVVAIRDKDSGKNRVKGQYVGIPATCHPEGVPAELKEKMTSFNTNKDAPILNQLSMDTFLRYYAAPPDNADAFPLLKSLDQLKGLPRTAIVICGSDPLADEGYQYANKLKAAGVDIKVNLYAGFPHSFWSLVTLETSKRFFNESAELTNWLLARL